VAIRIFEGWLPDRVGRSRVAYPALGTLAAGFLVTALGSSTTWTVVAGVLCGGGLGYAYPILFAGVVERSSAEERGSAMAAFTVFLDAGTLVGSPVLGWVILHFGYTAMFTTAAIVVIVSSIAYAAWDGDLALHRRPVAERI
jgi:MFS family permease